MVTTPPLSRCRTRPRDRAEGGDTMGFMKHVVGLATLFLALNGAASAQPSKEHTYELLNPAQPTESGKKIEVAEFFWYACPHCYALQAPLIAWLKKKPADVEFKRVPAVLSESWLQLARTYYT